MLWNMLKYDYKNKISVNIECRMNRKYQKNIKRTLAPVIWCRLNFCKKKIKKMKIKLEIQCYGK